MSRSIIAKSLLVLLCVIASPAWAITVGNTNSANSGSTAVDTQTVNLSVTAGNRIIVACSVYNASITGIVVSDGVNGTYTNDTVASSTITATVFASIAATTTTTVTITCDPPTNAPIFLVALEVSGIASSYAGQTTTFEDISAGPADTAGVTTVTADLVMVAVTTGSGAGNTFSTPTGYTSVAALESLNDSAQGRVSYKIQSGSGTEDPQSTLGAGSWWRETIYTYKPGAGVTCGRLTLLGVGC